VIVRIGKPTTEKLLNLNKLKEFLFPSLCVLCSEILMLLNIIILITHGRAENKRECYQNEDLMW